MMYKALLFVFLLAGCTQQEAENAEIRPFLERCINEAYQTHVWMNEEGMCEEYECCWEYVPAALRAKYESGATMTIDEMQAIIAGIESSPSFIDTLAEGDAFIDLDYYEKYGIDWFNY